MALIALIEARGVGSLKVTFLSASRTSFIFHLFIFIACFFILHFSSSLVNSLLSSRVVYSSFRSFLMLIKADLWCLADNILPKLTGRMVMRFY